MQKKLKKQRRKLIIKISAILIAVWLVVSCAYAMVAYHNEKDREYDNARIAFSSWQKNMEPYGSNPVLFMDDARMSAVFTDHQDNDSDTSDISYVYDPDVNLVIRDIKRKSTYDSDDIINFQLTAETNPDEEHRETFFGYISYSRFRASMTDEQYKRILSYLDNQPDGLYYYELICSEFYQNDQDELIPKQVQIVSTRDVHKWHVQDIPVETFDLTPQNVRGLTKYHISYLQRNVIPEDFIRHNFGSGGLMAQAQQLAQAKAQEMTEQGFAINDYAGLLKTGSFEYIYYDFSTVSSHIVQYSLDTMEDIDEGDPAAIYYTLDRDYQVYYARRLNILSGCIGNILTVTGALFLFFLVIGLILTMMMWRTLKIQIVEEQKRRDMTNALAHDIKTPLFILSGYAGNLIENVQTDKREHYAQVIVEQSQEVNLRVNRMLELSKLDSPNLKLNKQEFDLAELTREILSNYEALPDGKTVDFTVNTADDRCIIHADRDLMKRAIENLVDNAVKYADNKTEVSISITNHVFEIRNHCSNPEISQRMNKLSSHGGNHLDASSDSKGFGLSIVKAIMDLHHFRLKSCCKDQIVLLTIVF